MSLPGERIGYLVIPDEADGFENLLCAANVANRILGFVNAPSIMQLAVARCLEETTDILYMIQTVNFYIISWYHMGLSV